MLYCYGHLDNTEGIFVAPERKKSYKVRGCGLFMEHPVRTHTTQPEVPPEILHKRCRGAGSAQSHIEGFFGG
jgi:hypothetical protein